MKKRLSLILCSAPNMKSGRAIAKKLLDEKLAACVSILPGAESHYVWKGKREQAKEVLLLIKAPFAFYSAIEKKIKSIHPYECPEILQIAVDNGFKDYMEWAFSETKRRKSKKN